MSQVSEEGSSTAWRVWAESEPVDPKSWSGRVDALLDRLGNTPGVHGPVGWGAGPVLGAVFGVEADRLDQAARFALNAFGAALEVAADKRGVSIRRFEISDGDLETVYLLGATDVAKLLGVSRQRVYQLAKTPGFPRPVAEPARGSLWARSQIKAWAANRAGRRRVEPKGRAAG